MEWVIQCANSEKISGKGDEYFVSALDMKAAGKSSGNRSLHEEIWVKEYILRNECTDLIGAELSNTEAFVILCLLYCDKSQRTSFMITLSWS